jgi:hypothetical protein
MDRVFKRRQAVWPGANEVVPRAAGSSLYEKDEFFYWLFSGKAERCEFHSN